MFFTDTIEELGLSDIAAEVGIGVLAGHLGGQACDATAAVDVTTTAGCAQTLGVKPLASCIITILRCSFILVANRDSIVGPDDQAKSSATMTMCCDSGALAGSTLPSASLCGTDEPSAKKKRLQRAHGGKQVRLSLHGHSRIRKLGCATWQDELTRLCTLL